MIFLDDLRRPRQPIIRPRLRHKRKVIRNRRPMPRFEPVMSRPIQRRVLADRSHPTESSDRLPEKNCAPRDATPVPPKCSPAARTAFAKSPITSRCGPIFAAVQSLNAQPAVVHREPITDAPQPAPRVLRSSLFKQRHAHFAGSNFSALNRGIKSLYPKLVLRPICRDVMLIFLRTLVIHLPRIPLAAKRRHRVRAPMNENPEFRIRIPLGALHTSAAIPNPLGTALSPSARFTSASSA